MAFVSAPGAAPTDRGSGPVHLFNGFINPHGGSELETLSLHALLKKEADVYLWASSSRASPMLLQTLPIRRVSPATGAAPRGGTYVFIGAHWRNKLWPYLIARPRRLIYVYNTFHPKAVALTSRMPRLLRWPPAEYVLISDFQKRLAGLPGQVQVHPSPIDIRRFFPVARKRGERIVIGRMSRDAPDKHDPDDIALYRALAQQGYRVRLQGAGCIAAVLGDTPLIEATPEGLEPAELFLRSLDIFYYRSGVHVETFGRVVFEAMACARPVVCHAHGGYAEWIRHGENGFLFETTDQARALLAMLIADPAMCERVGAAARTTVEQMYSATALARRASFYLR